VVRHCRNLKVRFADRFSGLGIAFVAVDGRVELGHWRASNSFSRASCSKDRPGSAVKGFSNPAVCGCSSAATQGAQRVLDALHGADRIVGVYMRVVGSRASVKSSGTGAAGWSRLRNSKPLKAARLRSV
jgi:hypothetical protein